MKSKILAILLLVSICLSAFASCSGGDKGGDSSDNSSPPAKTMLTAAEEIANEVDSIPPLAELVLPDADALVIEEAAYEYSESGIENQQVSAYDKFDQVDGTVENLKRLKNECLSVCRSFDTWVRFTDHDIKIDYKLHYDVNNNVVTVENRITYSNNSKFSYSKITVTYDGDGKLLIDYYYAAFEKDRIINAEEIHYLEDVYFCHILESADFFSERMEFYDLQNKAWSETIMSYTAHFDDNGVYSIEYGEPIITYNYFKDGFFVKNTDDSGEIYYEDGRLLGQWSYTFGSNYLLNLNLFDGWTSIDQSGDSVMLNSTAGEIICPAYDNLIADEFKYRVTWFEGWGWPNFSIRSIEDEVFSPEQVKAYFTAAAELLGISGAESVIEFIAEQSFEYDTYHNVFHYMNGLYGPDLNSETFYLLVDMISYEVLELDDLLEIMDAPFIQSYDQTGAFEYFEFIEFSLDGEASVSDDGKTIDLSGFKAVCEPSLLLKDDESYSLVFVFASPTVCVSLGSSSAVYSGDQLVIESALSVSCDAYPKSYGEYVLKVYLADKNQTRISEAYVVSSSVSEEVKTTVDLSGEDIGSEITVTADSVRIYNYVLPSDDEAEA